MFYIIVLKLIEWVVTGDTEIWKKVMEEPITEKERLGSIIFSLSIMVLSSNSFALLTFKSILVCTLYALFMYLLYFLGL